MKITHILNNWPHLWCYFTHRLHHIYYHSFLWHIWTLPSCCDLSGRYPLVVTYLGVIILLWLIWALPSCYFLLQETYPNSAPIWFSDSEDVGLTAVVARLGDVPSQYHNVMSSLSLSSSFIQEKAYRFNLYLIWLFMTWLCGDFNI